MSNPLVIIGNGMVAAAYATSAPSARSYSSASATASRRQLNVD
jgi:hypothetical protein